VTCYHEWRLHPCGTTFCRLCRETVPFLRQSCPAHGLDVDRWCVTCRTFAEFWESRLPRLAAHRLDARVADVVDLFEVR
jgi:hypothetical protein